MERSLTLSIRPLAGTFAAEIRGVDLRRPTRTLLEAVYDAFLQHRVVVLPGQALSVDQQIAIGETFGELWELPCWSVKRQEARPVVDAISNVGPDGMLLEPTSASLAFQKANQHWHSDLQSRPAGSHASMLHALEIPHDGGETEFADCVAAYEALSPQTRSRIDGLIARHSLAHSRSGERDLVDVELLSFRVPPTLHPLVRIHPETGRRSLFVGNYIESVVGVEAEEGRRLVEELTAFATSPQFVYTHRWAVNDLVIWDNRSTLHRGREYPAGSRRVMNRITVLASEPTMQDGEIAPTRVRRRALRLETTPA